MMVGVNNFQWCVWRRGSVMKYWLAGQTILGLTIFVLELSKWCWTIFDTKWLLWNIVSYKMNYTMKLLLATPTTLGLALSTPTTNGLWLPTPPVIGTFLCNSVSLGNVPCDSACHWHMFLMWFHNQNMIEKRDSKTRLRMAWFLKIVMTSHWRHHSVWFECFDVIGPSLNCNILGSICPFRLILLQWALEYVLGKLWAFELH